MVQDRMEKLEIGLKNLESFILELVLLAYPLLLISGNIRVSPHYLIIVLGILVGIASFILLTGRLDSTALRLILTLLVAGPLYFIGMPLTVSILIYVYTIWRMNVNFGPERSTRWNFLFINIIVFACFFVFTRIYLLEPGATEINQVNVRLFLYTTIIFIVLRYSGIILLNRHISNYKLGATNKVFFMIMGVGLATYLVVYYSIETIRTAIIASFSFMFGSIFNKFAETLMPTIQQLELPESKNDEIHEEDFIYPILNEETNYSVYIAIVVIVLAVAVLILISRRQKKGQMSIHRKTYQFMSKGRKEKKHIANEENEYSLLQNDVRAAYKRFENDAISAKYPRSTGETVKEWFYRMSWGQDAQLFSTYDKARYGSSTITDSEVKQFINELKKIKEIYFV